MADADNASTEEEVVEYLFRRHEFTENQFLPQWQALQAAGVKFSNPTYSYQGRRFGSAMDLQTALDQYAVRSRVSVWERERDNSTDYSGRDITATMDPLMEQLRRDVCRHFYKIGKFYKPARESYSNDNEESKEKVDDKEKAATRSSKRRRGKTPESTTAALQSSDIYLRRKKKKRKVTATSKGTSADEASSFVFPTVQECRALTRRFDTSYAEELESQHAANDFAFWKMALATGSYHLLFYGHGSKLKLLQSFCDTSLSECLTLQIQGWENAASVSSIVDLLQIHSTQTTPNNQNSPPTILVIHSLDALLQREKDSKAALEVLVTTSAARHLRLVCSVNHVDPPVVTEQFGRRRILYLPVHTHRPVELSEVGDAAAVARPAARQRRSADRMWAVLQNLAPRYAEVLQVLARLLLEQTSTATIWILYKDFLEACRAGCLIDKDGKLRGLLQELKDHGLLVIRAEAGADAVSIPFDHNTLRNIVKYEPRKGR